jgi:hypothetical protein
MVGMLVLAAFFFLAGCVTGKKISASSNEFAKKTDVRLKYSLNGYSWIKTEYSKQIKQDLKKGRIEFSFAEDDDYLLRTAKEGDVLFTTWGKQLLLFTKDVRGTVIAAFLGSAYAMVNNNDGWAIHNAYHYIHQLTAGGSGNMRYIGRQGIDGEDKTEILYNGLYDYKWGGDGWQQFMKDNFHIEDFTIRILHPAAN